MSPVSVVIPTFNRASWIGRAIDSVLKQSWKNLEIIIVDDGSTDNTENCIPESEHVSVRYFKTVNRGAAAARNFGVKKSTGKWIAFLDSDDSWMPNKLEEQMNLVTSGAEPRVIYTQERWIRNGVRVNSPARYSKYSGNVFLHCLPVCLMAPSSLLMEKDLFWTLGGFDESYPVCEDYEFNLRIAGTYNVALVEKELICKYGGHSDQLSTAYTGIDYWRLLALCGILRTGNFPVDYIDAVHAEIDRKAAVYLTGCSRRKKWEEFRKSTAMIQEVYPEFHFSAIF